jgi:hypothetical protein
MILYEMVEANILFLLKLSDKFLGKSRNGELFDSLQTERMSGVKILGKFPKVVTCLLFLDEIRCNAVSNRSYSSRLSSEFGDLRGKTTLSPTPISSE